MDNKEFTVNLDEELKNEILYQAIENELNNSKSETLKKNNVKPKSRKKKKNFLTRLKKGITVRTVLLLLVTLIINTYAWFIYVSTVTASISMHIKNWDIQFSDNVIDEEFNFYVDKIYPGMDDAQQTITIANNGETNGKLKCAITSFKIFEETYEIGRDYVDEHGGTFRYTSADLLNKITTDYPFTISISVNGTEYTDRNRNSCWNWRYCKCFISSSLAI